MDSLTSHGNILIRNTLIPMVDSLLRETRADKILKEKIKIEDNILKIKGNDIQLNFERIFVVGFGKASIPMARALEEIMGRRINGGIISSPYKGSLKRIKVMVASHPFPDERTLEASEEIVELVKMAEEDDLVIVLVSGGASSLFEIPVDGMSIEEEARMVRERMLKGDDIITLNKLRIKLSKVKGGKFVDYIRPAKCISLILSDVIGPPEFVGSGPTYGKGCMNILIADNRYALKKAQKLARERGFTARISPTILSGEPKTMAKKIIESFQGRMTIWGGETTVRVEKGGIGGRNQELSLYLAEKLDRNAGFICIGTDGIDGPTNAAGGVVDDRTIIRARNLGMDIKSILKEHNSYIALKKLEDLIITGYTGTNLADVCIGLRL
ncbi:putative glycerate kinase [Aciduliprofundum sp. MAR08-339]|nr:putative glycerate kinase [Aciduliprofundum sp. MAR08-339]